MLRLVVATCLPSIRSFLVVTIEDGKAKLGRSEKTKIGKKEKRKKSVEDLMKSYVPKVVQILILKNKKNKKIAEDLKT